MKTIICSVTKNSKYLFSDNKQIDAQSGCINVGDPNDLDFIIGDMNSGNAEVIEGVTEPEDWFGCKYDYIEGAWQLNADWVDPRVTD